jgi:hypothetical protein
LSGSARLNLEQRQERGTLELQRLIEDAQRALDTAMGEELRGFEAEPGAGGFSLLDTGLGPVADPVREQPLQAVLLA